MYSIIHYSLRELRRTTLLIGYVSCIVLYPYIYIALLAVHTNQKRFSARDPERREQHWENKKRHLAHQLTTMHQRWKDSCSIVLCWFVMS